MEHSGFFNAVRDGQGNYDRTYMAEDLAQFFSSFISNGIFPSPSTNCQIIANSDMTVTVKVGKAGINGYQYYNDADFISPIDIADGVLNRIDRIVLRLDTANRAINAVVKKGTFASSPIATPLQRDADAYELALADIYIGAGATSIIQANITDLRQNSDVCGWVDSILKVDSATLFNQWTDAFNRWFTTARGTLSTDAAGNLLNMLSDTKEFSTYKSNIDSNGIATEIDLKRKDGTLILKSVLSGGTSPNYTTRAETHYEADGTTVGEIITYTILYDASGNFISEVIQ